jgi:hypothetical protein
MTSPDGVIAIDLKQLLESQVQDGNFLRYDLMVRYLMATSLAGTAFQPPGADPQVLELYREMQIKRRKRPPGSRVRRFAALLRSIGAEGFSSAFPIPVNHDLRLLNGAHRFAAALYFKLERVPVTKLRKESPPPYGRAWFEQNEFSERFLQRLDALKNDIFRDYGASTSS